MQQDDTFEGFEASPGMFEIEDILPNHKETIEIRVNTQPGSPRSGQIVSEWEVMDPATMRRYRKLYHGEGGKRGNSRKAIEYVIGEKFRRFLNLNIRDLAAYNGDQKQWALKAPDGQYLMEFFVAQAYLNNQCPDVDDTKE